MKTITAVGALLLMASVGHAQSLTASQAKAHEGETATVCGVVAGERTASSSRGEPTFINLDSAYPNHVFTVLVWGDDRRNVGALPKVGSHVCAKGLITDYRGIPEIVVGSGGQLTPASQSMEAPAKDMDKADTSCATCSNLMEVDWRPNHSYPSTIHVNGVNSNSVDVTITIGRYVASGIVHKNEIIDSTSCEGDCFRWKWEAGKDYSVRVHESPAYIPSCLKTSEGWVDNCHHRELDATRDISIDFGKMEKTKLPCCGDEEFDKPEFTVIYSVSVPVADPLRMPSNLGRPK
jgi:hypothetical protein